MPKIKPSSKFENAYTIEGMEGHYYLDNAKEDTLLNIIRVKRMTYSGKWYTETVHFYPEKYRELMNSI